MFVQMSCLMEVNFLVADVFGWRVTHLKCPFRTIIRNYLSLGKFIL
jgi:hypothetical protein